MQAEAERQRESAEELRLKKLEEELRRQETRFQQLVDLLPETVYEMDPDGRIRFLNRTGFKRFGLTPQDLERGIYPQDFLPPEDRERYAENLCKAINGALPGPNEYIVVLRDGSKLFCLPHSAPVSRDGKVIGLRGVLVDITARKRTEEALRADITKKRHRKPAGGCRSKRQIP